MTRRLLRSLPLLGALLVVSQALAQVDPIALQQQRDPAHRRLRRARSARPATSAPRLPDLAQAERELAASNQMLAARGDWTRLRSA